MKLIPMGDGERNVFRQAVDYASEWCGRHNWEVGAAEMALGAALITWGVQNGAIEVGADIVGSVLSGSGIGKQAGAAIGAGAGAFASAVLGSIGFAALGTAVGVPALVVIGGGSFVLASFGYTAGDLVDQFLNPPVNVGELFANASALTVGVALLVDGARRLARDPNVLAAAAYVKDGIIYLSDLTVKVIVRTWDDLKAVIVDMDAAGSALGGATGAVGGAVVGTAIAAGSVTVLGSSTLGGVALSLGLISAPVWPVIAGGALGLSVGYAAWKATKYFVTRK